MVTYELIEHTADIGIRVKGKDLKELFQNTALAMFDIMAEKSSQFAVRSSELKNITIKQKADNLEELFVNWLNELLSLSSAKELIFSDFKINKLDENNLDIIAIGEDIKNYKVNTEVKAATYHQLKIGQTKSGWQAEVIFDV
jgi:SHS2 domain-containing protein